jgi:hypothetical protein
MAEFVEEEITSKLENLDFEKDPFEVCGKLIEEVQKLDSLSGR